MSERGMNVSYCFNCRRSRVFIVEPIGNGQIIATCQKCDGGFEVKEIDGQMMIKTEDLHRG